MLAAQCSNQCVIDQPRYRQYQGSTGALSGGLFDRIALIVKFFRLCSSLSKSDYGILINATPQFETATQ